MATIAGSLDDGLTAMMGDAGFAIVVAGLSASLGVPPTWQSWGLLDIDPGSSGAAAAFASAVTPRRVAGGDTRTALDDWFERVHVFPHKIEAGIVLSTKEFTLDFFNAYRKTKRILSSYVNNVGTGITVPDLPGLPHNVEVFGGFQVTVDVLPDGSPTIAGTLDFVFDDRTILIPVTGDRAVLLPLEPVSPLVEFLQFHTGILQRRDGREQRAALRQHPRQIFELIYELEGFDRQYLEARLFGGQSRIFGVPVWAEAAQLTTAIAPGATVATVDTTAYADLRVDGLAVVWDDTTNFEALSIQSIGPTSVTFHSSFTKSFPLGARLMPIRAAVLDGTIPGEKYPQKLQRAHVRATVIDPGVDLASAAAFPSLLGKVLLDDGNRIDQNLTEQNNQDIVVVDSQTGAVHVESLWPVSRRSSVKGFRAGSRQKLWEVRQVLHFLRGRAVSFYLPTYFDEFVLTQDINSASAAMRFQNFGFSKFVMGSKPRGHIRLVLKSGTTVARTIQSSQEVDAATEQITVTATWGVNAAIAAIERVEYIELTRFDTDDIEIRHYTGHGDAMISSAVKTVLE